MTPWWRDTRFCTVCADVFKVKNIICVYTSVFFPSTFFFFSREREILWFYTNLISVLLTANLPRCVCKTEIARVGITTHPLKVKPVAQPMGWSGCLDTLLEPCMFFFKFTYQNNYTSTFDNCALDYLRFRDYMIRVFHSIERSGLFWGVVLGRHSLSKKS